MSKSTQETRTRRYVNACDRMTRAWETLRKAQREYDAAAANLNPRDRALVLAEHGIDTRNAQADDFGA